MLISGFLYNDVIAITLGFTLSFVSAMSIVSTIFIGKFKFKKLLESFSIIIATLTITYGYLLTKSMFLALIVIIMIIFLILNIVISFKSFRR